MAISISKYSIVGLTILVIMALMLNVAFAEGTTTITTVTTTSVTSIATTTVRGCPIHVPSTTTIIYSGIVLPNHVYPSNSSNKFTVNVKGGGFHQNSTIVFGYQPSSNFSKIMINTRSDCNGNWNGSFTAPWSIGPYSMYAADAQGALGNVNLIVTNRNPTIVLPNHVLPTNSVFKSIVNLTGFGFIPNTHIQFGYYPIPPYSHVMVDAITNSNGDWSGSFTAPWAAGSYQMIGLGSGVSANTTLVVATTTTAFTTASTTTI